jgi:hypothetical protein
MAKEILENEITSPTGRFKNKPTHLDREQLEYSAQTILTYGTIMFAVTLGLGSVAYMTFQQLKK